MYSDTVFLVLLIEVGAKRSQSAISASGWGCAFFGSATWPSICWAHGSSSLLGLLALASGTATGPVTQEARLLGCLAVAATSPGYAAAYTYSTPYPYSTPHAVESPPAQAASCASTTTATSKAEAHSATSAAATSATTSAASATTATTTAAAATSGELNSGLE
jgi:hypothetical protein